VDGVGAIELLHGDLTELPPEHAVDVLILSAFPDNYAPTKTSLIGALHRRGLSVAALATDKEWDLRSNFSCWMSRDIPDEGFNFKRILCFETGHRGSPDELVGDIFHALAPFVFGPPNIRSVAMPVLASGNQGHDFEVMLRGLLIAATHAMTGAAPLDVVKIVVRSQDELSRARKVFEAFEVQSGAGGATVRSASLFGDIFYARTDAGSPLESGGTSASPVDVFISYSRADESVATSLANDLRAAGLRVFLDTSAIKHGAAWLEKIHDALDCCRAVVPIYSPDFLKSRPCKWEFNLACNRNIECDEEFIFPVLIRDADLPIYMRAINYRDCRISDLSKVSVVAGELAAVLLKQ